MRVLQFLVALAGARATTSQNIFFGLFPTPAPAPAPASRLANREDQAFLGWNFEKTGVTTSASTKFGFLANWGGARRRRLLQAPYASPYAPVSSTSYTYSQDNSLYNPYVSTSTRCSDSFVEAVEQELLRAAMEEVCFQEFCVSDTQEASQSKVSRCTESGDGSVEIEWEVLSPDEATGAVFSAKAKISEADPQSTVIWSETFRIANGISYAQTSDVSVDNNQQPPSTTVQQRPQISQRPALTQQRPQISQRPALTQQRLQRPQIYQRPQIQQPPYRPPQQPPYRPPPIARPPPPPPPPLPPPPPPPMGYPKPMPIAGPYPGYPGYYPNPNEGSNHGRFNPGYYGPAGSYCDAQNACPSGTCNFDTFRCQ